MEILNKINDFFDNALNDPISILIIISALLLLFAFFVLIITKPKQPIEVTGKKNEREKTKESKHKNSEVIKEKLDEKDDAKTGKEKIDLRKNYKYVVAKKNKLKPGKYILYSADQGVTKFEIDRSSYKKQYENGDTVEFDEGQEITSKTVAISLIVA